MKRAYKMLITHENGNSEQHVTLKTINIDT